ncbi:MAG: RdgB/HAM1 family non-canonical purine NTP pyrophosphatase [Beutenbergiaceae bacterium]
MTTARLVLATRNAHKLGELRDILEEAGIDGSAVVSAADVAAADVAETGVTFAENALLKAQAVAAHSGLPAVADDSGLAVDVLGGAPGIFSARWAGHHGDDPANLALLLAQLADVPDEHRGAGFVCAAALVHPDGTQTVTEGVLRGTLLREPVGEGGFGYDPILVPQGQLRSCAQLSAAEKNAISHRGQAFRALAPALAQVLGA